MAEPDDPNLPPIQAPNINGGSIGQGPQSEISSDNGYRRRPSPDEHVAQDGLEGGGIPPPQNRGGDFPGHPGVREIINDNNGPEGDPLDDEEVEGGPQEREPLIQIQATGCVVIKRRTCASICNLKVQCIGGLVLLLMAAVVVVAATGLGLMLKNEQGKPVHIYTSANEASVVYKSTDAILTKSVCMKTHERNYILFTSDCKTPTVLTRNYTTNIMTIHRSKSFFFYFVRGSRITLHKHGSGSGNAWYSSSKHDNVQKLRDTCIEEKNPLPAPDIPFEDLDGYYCVCIVPVDTQVTFHMFVKERYYNIPSEDRNECNQTDYFDKSLKCCHFTQKNTFSTHRNYTYVSTTNTKPTLLTQLDSVDVTIKYDVTTKVVPIVLMAILLPAMIVVVIAVYCVEFKVRRAANAPQPG